VSLINAPARTGILTSALQCDRWRGV